MKNQKKIFLPTPAIKLNEDTTHRVFLSLNHYFSVHIYLSSCFIVARSTKSFSYTANTVYWKNLLLHVHLLFLFEAHMKKHEEYQNLHCLLYLSRTLYFFVIHAIRFYRSIYFYMVMLFVSLLINNLWWKIFLYRIINNVTSSSQKFSK